MKIKALGHVVLKVADRSRSEAFYGGVLGLPVVARFEDGPKMAFFSLGDHHNFAVMEVGPGAASAANQPGLHHVAFKIGESLDDLREAKAHLEGAGVVVTPIDHEVTKSLYFDDPDGNNVEVYVDVSDVWKRDPQRVAQIAPLAL
ncbi:MAG TPA: VOC family protein [Caulobacteraceae bacterium]|nr:VOC family protein [Caulobacteraceae bacterium]